MAQIARNIELYNSAYSLAWKKISEPEKRELPDVALRLDASIRRQLKDGATEPLFIASESIKEVDEAFREQMKSGWKEILDYCGTRAKALYKISGRLVTVVYGNQTKTAQLGILPAEKLAHMLLRLMEFERQQSERNTLGG
jgi:hypothetical protein